jgi:hypothetical protein
MRKKYVFFSKKPPPQNDLLLRYIKNFFAAGIQDVAEVSTNIWGYKKPRKINPLISFTVYMLQC